jgi:hypothetical protein
MVGSKINWLISSLIYFYFYNFYKCDMNVTSSPGYYFIHNNLFKHLQCTIVIKGSTVVRFSFFFMSIVDYVFFSIFPLLPLSLVEIFSTVPVFSHLESIFFPQVERSSFTPIINMQQNYVLIFIDMVYKFYI